MVCARFLFRAPRILTSFLAAECNLLVAKNTYFSAEKCNLLGVNRIASVLAQSHRDSHAHSPAANIAVLTGSRVVIP